MLGLKITNISYNVIKFNLITIYYNNLIIKFNQYKQYDFTVSIKLFVISILFS